MELEELEKSIAEFGAKLKPVSVKTKQMAAGISVAPTPVAEEPAPVAAAKEGEACVTKQFKTMVAVLPASYISSQDGKDMQDFIGQFLESLPECKE